MDKVLGKFVGKRIKIFIIFAKNYLHIKKIIIYFVSRNKKESNYVVVERKNQGRRTEGHTSEDCNF